MIEVIKSKNELCTGCNRCVRECPMEVANISYKDDDGEIKVDIDLEKCIACGRCVTACKHDARYFVDDTGRFFDDLANGIPISVIAAPAIKTNIPEFKKLFTYLKQLGVKMIFDVSFGADICIWAHIRHIEKNGVSPMITQPCPAIVTYCEMYRHDLLKRLSPIHSPMACTSIYMKKYRGIEDRIAAISPCMAKENEFESTKLADYNITFEKILEYIHNKKIKLPDEQTEFDHAEGNLGSLFPMPGGLKENIEYFIDKKVHIAKSEGFDIYENLDLYAKTPEIFLPDIFDVLNCSEGCNIGTANSHEKSMFEIDKAMNIKRNSATNEQKSEYYKALYKEFDDAFDLSDFLRTYKPVHVSVPDITDEDIENSFELLGKTDYEKQNIDCSACGSDSCLGMARKIALGVNFPTNCIFKSKEDAKKEHIENMQVHTQIMELEKMHEADERMRIMLDTTPISAHFWDENYQLVDCNLAAVRMFDLSNKQEYLEKYFDLTPEFQPDGQRSIDKIKSIIKEAYEKGYKRDELIRQSLDGEQIPVEATFVLVETKGEKLVAGYCRDLREYKRMTRELESTLEKAQAASRAKGDFLANMSHEIRTPMNTIIGMTNIAKSTQNIDKKEYALEKIEDASNHLLGIINDILDMSKIEADKLELHPEAFVFDELLKKATNIINFRIVEKEQKLSVNIDRKIPQMIICDGQRLAQIIANLLSNAVKFTNDGGLISLKAILEEEIDDTLLIRFDVTDSGVGISEEHQTRLFNPFEQAENSTTRKYGGTGLGLAITKRIVEMMEGSISASSVLGKGSTFTFTIKAKKPDKATEEKRDAGSEDKKQFKLNDQADKFTGRRILLVEDVDINREIVITLLEPLNLEIDCAENGQEAVRMFKESPEKYDLIFMDLQMPEMDGYDATRMIRSLAKTADSTEAKNKAEAIPIIAMTANVFKEDIDNCYAAGMNGHVGKPLDLKEVMDVLIEMLLIPDKNRSS